MTPEPLPYLTDGWEGIGGRARVLPEDFRVDERPLYFPCGEGEHLYVRITKRLLSTPDLIRKISSSIGMKVQAIGTAGLKDARAVTSQMVSLQGTTPDRLSRLKLDEQVLSVEVLGRHRNRLRPGHHAGNRFRLVLRDVAAHAPEAVPAVLEQLARRGVPNYFGPQRQGKEGNNFRLGAALLNDPVRRNSMSKAKRLWYLNSFQSHLFNQILARRISRLDQVLQGDWAMKHENGACFPVEDALKEQPRADRFEISPTGILFGSRVSWATGEPGDCETAVAELNGTAPEHLITASKSCGLRGERRALRVAMTDLDWTLLDSQLTLTFTLPPGAYATNVLRELMKSSAPV
ncbi:tRNA pseudouridine synthase D [Nitrospira sp. KM1]|uniref:tRNA pseudouridine(13) synthase TruD n=1 Tax=Nitrospira sp. KM1 TaxID=1936990 RepID=UPI0013A789F8|nr:tRNA pseudouridine(13) synthase TruD [Nitrospira sp. KM1]BCA55676.1 tRNA pseudouridine synthase D [Nitrospira sp. KM1]